MVALTLGAALTPLLDDESGSASSRGCVPLGMAPFTGVSVREWPLATSAGVGSVSIASPSPACPFESDRCAGGGIGAGEWEARRSAGGWNEED